MCLDGCRFGNVYLDDRCHVTSDCGGSIVGGCALYLDLRMLIETEGMRCFR